MSSPKTIKLLSIIAMLLATLPVLAQPLDGHSKLALYQSARNAYANRQFQKSASEFRSVAEQSQGSELAIQCEYFAAMSEWALEPCDGCAEKLTAWHSKAKTFQEDAKAAGRTFNSLQLLKWTESAELVRAKWDRQKQRFELAEQRLRKILETASADPKQTKTNPGVWLELGSLLLENRQDYASARTCFDNALLNTMESEPAQYQAILGCAMTCWNSQQYAEANMFLDRLSNQKIDDELKIQSELLRTRLAKAMGETIDFAQTLAPVVRLALASNPSASLLYELAMALIESGEASSSNELLLRLVQRFPESPFSVEARVRLARNACDKKQWREANEWADQALSIGCSNELQPYARLLRGQARLELGAFEDAKVDLQAAIASPTGDLQLEISVRFQLAETLYNLQRWQEADDHWNWLVKIAESSDDTSPKPEWYPLVLLRSAELLALRKEWVQAEKLVLRIRNDFPKCNRACEVDYLFARCLVSKADFDAARQVLTSVTQRVNSTPDELLARGHWMMGETYLMQRRHSDALTAYQSGLAVPKQEYWNSACLLQMAQCHEALQDLQSAKEAYDTLINQFGDSPFVVTARERLKNMPTISVASQQANVPLGAKR